MLSLSYYLLTYVGSGTRISVPKWRRPRGEILALVSHYQRAAGSGGGVQPVRVEVNYSPDLETALAFYPSFVDDLFRKGLKAKIHKDAEVLLMGKGNFLIDCLGRSVAYMQLKFAVINYVANLAG